ncbi:Rieske 2Fe-2S domain-containing protein [Pseudomonas aeruginosa]|nr:Rieske 2Fe-2S domain-containing protein [Pseudomonas aeruginosa]MDF5863057.1 Rieske 2Fe-2S domain-containing protein [Pseudomonas aeruginosa]
MFPKNAWYVACTPDELAGKPLGRRICDEPMVFYRGEDGRVAALEDFCPHRGAPLSLGFVEDGVLVCGYHGLAMGEDGRTRAMPGQRVRGFPASVASRCRNGTASSGSGRARKNRPTPR